MSKNKQVSATTLNRGWAAIVPILLLAPLSMAAKGCSSAVVGNDCPELVSAAGETNPCNTAGAAGAGSAGSPGSAGSLGSAGGGPQSAICGGLLGLACASDEYCAFPVSASCGSGDQTGVCQERPKQCDLVYSPVCGCDGQTYGNSCEAASKGTAVAKNEACASEPGKTCGGLLGAGCAKGEFCSFAPEAMCGAADQTGTCAPRPTVCDDILRPVCGCDGKTYGNACEAGSAGVSVAANGACANTPMPGKVCGGLRGVACGKGEFCSFPPNAMCGAADQTGTCQTPPQACDAILAPVCGCDGKTYGSACAAALALTSVAKQGACEAPATACGGDRSLPCPTGQFCDVPVSGICGFADAPGTCRTPPRICTNEYAPVCGCDNKTYGNACSAASAGVSVAALGACAN